jgi:hypothetical protein
MGGHTVVSNRLEGTTLGKVAFELRLEEVREWVIGRASESKSLDPGARV